MEFAERGATWDDPSASIQFRPYPDIEVIDPERQLREFATACGERSIAMSRNPVAMASFTDSPVDGSRQLNIVELTALFLSDSTMEWQAKPRT
jgi:hypothetical protein